MKLRYEEFDLSGVKTYPLASRKSKASVKDFARPYLPGSGLAGLLGSLPADIQVVTVYSGAVLRRSPNQKLASDFLAFVTGPKVAQVFSAAGFGRY